MNIHLHPRLILLRGNYSEANFGDDALLIASYVLLHGQGRSIVVDGGFSYQDQRLAGLRSRNAQHEKADLIVYGGGTQFFDFGNDTDHHVTILRQIVRIITNPKKIFIDLLSRLRFHRNRRIPVIGIGLGIGPFATTAAEMVTAELIQRMKMVWVRDEAASAFCSKNAVNNSVAGADLCFTEAFRKTVQFVDRPPHTAHGQSRRVGIVLRDWFNLGPDFFERMIVVARQLRSHGIEVRFLSFAPSDCTYLGALAEANEEVLAWHAGYGSIETFWTEIASHDLLVTSRFHAGIFALLSSKPFISINIEPKLASLASMVPELPNLLLAPDDKVEVMVKQILAVLSIAAYAKPFLIAALDRQRALAAKAESALKTFLETEFTQ